MDLEATLTKGFLMITSAILFVGGMIGMVLDTQANFSILTGSIVFISGMVLLVLMLSAIFGNSGIIDEKTKN